MVSAAFFVLFAHNIDPPTFPATACGGFDCSQYNLFVASPLYFNSTHVQRLKAVSPNSIVLAYFDTIHVPIKSGCATGHTFGDHPGKNCSQVVLCPTTYNVSL